VSRHVRSRSARRWAKQHGEATAAAYVPLSFAPGEAYQFDWSHEVVLLNGVTVVVKAAHVRLCHSRMLFVRVYPRETQEMVFDVHDRAFALFKGTCGRGIYDNMKTAVETVFVGKDRLYCYPAHEPRGRMPRRAADRGKSTPDALHSELPHTDPAGRIAGARPLTRSPKTRHVIAPHRA
jgi:transposase